MLLVTSTQKNGQKPIISEEVADQIKGAFAALLGAVGNLGEAITTPADKLTKRDYERLAMRSVNALEARAAYVKEQEVAAFRQGVRDALESHLNAARAEKEEYDATREAMPEKMRKLLAPFPTHISVPLSDVSGAFGEETTEAVQVKKLTDMGYKVAKAPNGAYSLRIELPKSIVGDTSAK